MGSVRHLLKTDPEVFQASWDGVKNYELRLDDRGFEVGDTLVLRETQFTGEEMKAGKPLTYTGRELIRPIGHILRGPIYGLQKGWVILAYAYRAAGIE